MTSRVTKRQLCIPPPQKKQQQNIVYQVWHETALPVKIIPSTQVLRTLISIKENVFISHTMPPPSYVLTQLRVTVSCVLSPNHSGTTTPRVR